MRNSGLTWTSDALRRFVADPGRFIAGTTMAAMAVTEPADQDALIAFLTMSTSTETKAMPRTQQDAASQRE
jgi:cytochrome c2